MLTRTAVFKAAWCRNAREVMKGDRRITIGNHTIHVYPKLPREQMFTLNHNTTVVFLAAGKARGMSEVEVISAIAHSIC